MAEDVKILFTYKSASPLGIIIQPLGIFAGRMKKALIHTAAFPDTDFPFHFFTTIQNNLPIFKNIRPLTESFSIFIIVLKY